MDASEKRNEGGSSSLWVSGIEHCLAGSSGTQHPDPQGTFKPKRFHHCPLLPSGLESEGLYKVILPTTTAPEHQCSLAITRSASRTGSAACSCLNNAPRTKLKARNHYKTGKHFYLSSLHTVLHLYKGLTTT